MNIEYLLLRFIRRFVPSPVMRFLLLRNLIVRPGLETRQPDAAAARYIQALERNGRSLKDKRILVFGYGGYYAIAAELLMAGASHVTLLDRFATPDKRRNRRLPLRFPDYFLVENGECRPIEKFITLIHDDVFNARVTESFDLVFSSSVYEHLHEVDRITAALASLTKPDGVHVHYVNLSDHYMKYPFEMLTFSETAWRRWLNPPSNLNRLRVGDYQRVFEKYFTELKVNILKRDPERFSQVRHRIRPEFLTGDQALDCATMIEIVASNPREGAQTHEWRASIRENNGQL